MKFEPSNPSYWLKLYERSSTDEYYKIVYAVRAGTYVDRSNRAICAELKRHGGEKIGKVFSIVINEIIKSLDELLSIHNKNHEKFNNEMRESNREIIASSIRAGNFMKTGRAGNYDNKK